MVFTIAQAPMPITRKTSDNGAHEHKDKSATANRGANPSAPTPLVSTQDNGSGSLKSESDNASPENQQGAINVTNAAPVSVPWSLPKWAVWLGWIANLVLTGFLIWGVLVARNSLEVIGEQTKQTARSAKATEDAAIAAKDGAKAAFLNAQAVIDAERPWLMENIARSNSSDRKWIVSIWNAGNTPAEIVDGYWCLSRISGDFKLPIDHERHLFLLQNTVIVKADSFKVEGLDMRILQSAAMGGFRESSSDREFKHVYFHGDVEYWDMFTDRSSPNAKPHVTQWCYVYNPHTEEFTRAPCTYHEHS